MTPPDLNQQQLEFLIDNFQPTIGKLGKKALIQVIVHKANVMNVAYDLGISHQGIYYNIGQLHKSLGLIKQAVDVLAIDISDPLGK